MRPKGPQVREFTRVCALEAEVHLSPLGFILGLQVRELTRVCALEAELHVKPTALHFKPKGLQVREFTRVCALEADWAG